MTRSGATLTGLASDESSDKGSNNRIGQYMRKPLLRPVPVGFDKGPAAGLPHSFICTMTNLMFRYNLNQLRGPCMSCFQSYTLDTKRQRNLETMMLQPGLQARNN